MQQEVASSPGPLATLLSPDPLAALALALLVQGECCAHKIPLEASMGAWDEAQLRAHFSSTHSTPPSDAVRPAPASLPSLPSPIPSKPAATRGAPPDPNAPRGNEWRHSAALRKSHWLCRACNMAISRAIPACATCLSADFSSSELKADDAPLLATRLRSSGVPLCALDVSHNPLGAAGVAALAVALGELPALTALNLAGTCASDGGSTSLADALLSSGTCPRLEELTLMGCSIKAKGGAALARLLAAGTPPLRTLGLGWNQIRGESAQELGLAAVASTTLKSFCGIPIGTLRSGCLPPVPPLSERDAMRRPAIDPAEELHLNGCGCGSPGAHALAALLPRLPQRRELKALVLPFQDLGDEGAEAVVSAAAASCPALTFLMLSRNDVGEDASSRIRRVLPLLDDFHLRINNRGG